MGVSFSSRPVGHAIAVYERGTKIWLYDPDSGTRVLASNRLVSWDNPLDLARKAFPREHVRSASWL